MLPKLARLYEAIREHVKALPDATIAELQAWPLEAHKVSATRGLICKTPALLGLTRKKSLRAEQDRSDIAAARQQWREAQPSLDPAKLIFIDEAWTKANMTRPMGRAPCGQRLASAVPHGH